eukprot:TRINITY_DN33893_c0_g1_i1.p1 TRINITY_DN33893_c0_g1~~TRINITY_DN33893_c0_g1_i1.p1  ORF type:complete len:208 (-),score=29.56 TRINITY_DN33893_c0_g1_i1:3-560(-)
MSDGQDDEDDTLSPGCFDAPADGLLVELRGTLSGTDGGAMTLMRPGDEFPVFRVVSSRAAVLIETLECFPIALLVHGDVPQKLVIERPDGSEFGVVNVDDDQSSMTLFRKERAIAMMDTSICGSRSTMCNNMQELIASVCRVTEGSAPAGEDVQLIQVTAGVDVCLVTAFVVAFAVFRSEKVVSV